MSEDTKDTKSEKVEEVESKPEPKVIKHNFKVGDKIVVNYKIVEGAKARVQAYEGLVIAIKNSGISKTFTVRRISTGGVGVERIFPYYSPSIESVVVKAKGRVRRAKLYYMRDRIGQAAMKIKEAK